MTQGDVVAKGTDVIVVAVQGSMVVVEAVP